MDFHSLRHTCGAWSAMTGAHPKAVQSLMRHSSITLTMDTYGHLFPGQEAETVARFPAMLGDQPHELRATSTYGSAKALSDGVQQYPQQLGSDFGQADSGLCEKITGGTEIYENPKALPGKALCASVRVDAGQDGDSHRPDSNRRPAVYKTQLILS
ncbi:MAG TPA: tyrosine-type recombinase/integrase [Phycisphaerae bacterium]|nr:tyrosine-type recombinase/integrase [Phycisphaerae bacterium]